MDLIKPLQRYRELNKKLNDDEYQNISTTISIITKHEKRRRKPLTLFNCFLNLPIEILVMIFFMNYKENCNQEHVWCANTKPNHRYSNRQTIFRLMEVCKNWYHIIASKVQRRIVLNRGFLDFDEQKRSLQFMKLIDSKNSFFNNHIREIVIYDNFFFNSIMMKIINKCSNLEKLILQYSTVLSKVMDIGYRRISYKHVKDSLNGCSSACCFLLISDIVFDKNSKNNFKEKFLKNLINYYNKNNLICRNDCCNETIYWGRNIYWEYCSKHKGSSEPLDFHDGQLISDLFYFTDSDSSFSD